VTIRLVRWALWAVLVSAALWPLLPALTPRGSALGTPARLLQAWFELHCAREPSRSLFLGAIQLSVCARCSGIYWGLGLGALVRRPDVSQGPLRLWLALAALLMLADVAAERAGLHASWPFARVATGLLLAYPFGARVGARLLRAPFHKP
jgi:uncharacterized membrane protein